MAKRFDVDAEPSAEVIAETFEQYIDRFRYLTHMARGSFERADWKDLQHLTVLRLDIYNNLRKEGLDELEERLASRIDDRDLWKEIHAAYAAMVAERGDVELAETFFNSMVRRVFGTVGVDPEIEFVSGEHHPSPHRGPWTLSTRFERDGSLDELCRTVLGSYRFDPPWDDFEGDAHRMASALRDEIGDRRIRGIELVRAPFFRGKGAYLVGFTHTDDISHALCIALTNPGGRIVVDAVLPTENETSIVFSFARSYFFVEMDRPRETIDFLRSVMPLKPLDELYNSIGFNRHGKTELYRALLRHLATTDDQFVVAPGQRGMVMSVFTLRDFPVVFKVIRDRFDYPKTVTHEEVRDKYRMVFRADRAGRLVDAQEFEHLEFDRARFAEPLLQELLSTAAENVVVRGDRVVIRHLYTERRLRPLDLYLREEPLEAQRDAVLEYGQTMRDLARTNIFPGDMLLKNFGASRHGRLIFYDYDELCRLTDLNFRVLPQARHGDDETAGEPWYYVGEHDIFPEEFRNFLGFKNEELLDAFLASHGELLEVKYWQRMQELHERGEVLDVYPYKTTRRLRKTPRSREAAGAERRRRGGKA